jgi:plastocyanin
VIKRRRWYWSVVLAALAAAVSAGNAGSQGPPVIAALDPDTYNASPRWGPSTVTIAPGGAVGFQYPAGDPPQGTSAHSVVFQNPPSTPSCSGVPQTNGAGQAAPWSGSCTFSAPGTYSFYCGVHGVAMSGTVKVAAPGPTGTGTDPTTGTGPNSGTTTGTTTVTATGQPPGAAPDASAFAVASSQKGTSVKGSVTIGYDRSSLSAVLTASGKLAKLTTVGSLVKSRLKAGPLRFSVPLSKRGKRALKRRHRLTLRLQVRVRAPNGSSTTLAKTVKLSQR